VVSVKIFEKLFPAEILCAFAADTDEGFDRKLVGEIGTVFPVILRLVNILFCCHCKGAFGWLCWLDLVKKVLHGFLERGWDSVFVQYLHPCRSSYCLCLQDLLCFLEEAERRFGIATPSSS